MVLRVVKNVEGLFILQQTGLVEPSLFPWSPILRLQARRIDRPRPQVLASTEADHRSALLQSLVRVGMVDAEVVSIDLFQFSRRMKSVFPENPVHRHVVL